MDETRAKFEKALNMVERMVEENKIPLTRISEPHVKTLIETGKELISREVTRKPQMSTSIEHVVSDSSWQALYEIALTLSSYTDLKLITESILDESIKFLNCERGLVVEVNSDGGMAIRVSRGVKSDEAADISSTLVKQAVSTQQSILYDSSKQSGSESLIRRQITNGLLAPFSLDNGNYGVIYVDSRDVSLKLDESHLDFLEKVAKLAGSALSSAIRVSREMDEGRSGAFKSVIGTSPEIRRLCERAARVARTDETVLLLGESGTGKEVFAKAIHNESKRAGEAFEAVNCSAIPAELLESELFGYEAGAFTGAKKEGKPGIFELADKGTIFLDEIGDMPAILQAKLLRVLQERSIRRVGGTRDIPIDVRIIAATNQDLDKKMEDKSFREDLYYRLSTFPLFLPPLRERGNDIILLTEFFLERFANEFGLQKPSLSPKAAAFFLEYPWRGNIRELENLIKRILIDHEPKVIHPKHLPDEMQNAQSMALAKFKKLDEIQHEHIETALNLVGGNRGKAAEILGISEATLYRWLADMKKG